MKCDVRKFFPNTDHAIIRAKLATVCCCPTVTALVARILSSYQTGSEITPGRIAGEEFWPWRPRGLPIGNLTSQLWGNFYLDALDHWLTEEKRHGAYLRYTDDFLVFGDDKARLRVLHEGIPERLTRVRLKLAEPKSRLLATGEGGVILRVSLSARFASANPGSDQAAL